MARSIEFDKPEALTAAIEAIWGRGYYAVSTNDLIAEMGLAKSSLYNTFGSKHQLFLAALSQYGDERAAQLAATLEQGAALDTLHGLLNSIASSNDGGKGCLLVNSAIEVAPHDSEVAATVRRGLAKMARVFAAFIRAAQARGEVGAHLDPEQAAMSLITGIAGLRVMAKAGFRPALLRQFIDGLLRGLEPRE
ncbi:MAG: TetR/AcrR family transcriptional regulator [Burkholderiales bacterium]|nr:TetR/AcrR family transcriptional regulator [Burkholderiales bacterium]MDE2290368.1 TetR/AcrR family transcriptional regulator [Burkholderiales bacterium]MDE2609905.1 TetR/AcrR family transcriptional regulator [Burkholderiales bacterium]